VERDTSGFLAEILQPIAEIAEGDDLAAQLAAAARGEEPSTAGTIALVRSSLIEWDINEEDAPRLLQDFLDAEGFQE